MSHWSQFSAKLRDAFGRLPASQRYLLVACVAGFLMAIGWFTLGDRANERASLFSGRVYSPSESRQTVALLKQAGVSDIKVIGGRVLVPATQLPACEALLARERSSGESPTGQREKLMNQPGWPMSESQRQELLDAAKAAELVEMFRKDPHIADARLMWNRSKRRGFSGETRVTVALTITPQAGHTVSSELAESLKTAVVSSFGLAGFDDVSLIEITPQGTKVVRPEEAVVSVVPENNGPDLQAISTELQSEISEKLSWIPNIKVTVIAQKEGKTHRTAYRPASSTDETDENDTEPELASQHRVTVEVPEEVSLWLLRPGERPSETRQPGEKPRRTRAEVKQRIEHTVSRILGINPEELPRDVVKVQFRDAPKKAQENSDVEQWVARLLAATRRSPGVAIGIVASLIALVTLPRLFRRADSNTVTLKSNLPEQRQDPIAVQSMLDDIDHSLQQEDADVDFRLSIPSQPTEADSYSHATSRDDDTQGAAPSMEPDRLGGEFAILHDCSADEWRQLLAGEQPQSIAVILSRLPPAQSAFILRLMPAGTRLDVVRRMTSLERPAPELLAEFAIVLEERLHELRRVRLREAESTNRAVKVPIIPASSVPKIVEAVGQRRFPHSSPADVLSPAQFHDLLMLDDGSLREVFDSFDLEHWAIALKGSDDGLIGKLVHALVPQDASALQQACHELGPVRLSDVDAAQRAIATRLTPLRWRGRKATRHVEHAEVEV